MCVVSMVGDYYQDKFAPIKDRPWYTPNSDPFRWPHHPTTPSTGTTPNIFITREEFDSLKKELLEMKELLTRAAEYDKRNNEPHCEMEDKVKFLKELARLFNIDLKGVFA